MIIISLIYVIIGFSFANLAKGASCGQGVHIGISHDLIMLHEPFIWIISIQHDKQIKDWLIYQK